MTFKLSVSNFVYHFEIYTQLQIQPRRKSFLVLEHQMSLRGKFVRTSLRWCLSLIYPASLLKFVTPHAIYWMCVRTFFLAPSLTLQVT